METWDFILLQQALRARPLQSDIDDMAVEDTGPDDMSTTSSEWTNSTVVEERLAERARLADLGAASSDEDGY